MLVVKINLLIILKKVKVEVNSANCCFGEEDVVNGRFNPIYGLSKKKYNE